jgi:hypothetical protein
MNFYSQVGQDQLFENGFLRKRNGVVFDVEACVIGNYHSHPGEYSDFRVGGSEEQWRLLDELGVWPL